MGAVGDLVGGAIGGIASGIGNIFGDITGTNKQVDASKDAAKLQAEVGLKGIEEQKRQFEAIQALLKPYVGAGTGALSGVTNLSGAGGAEAERAAIQAVQNSPEYLEAIRSGENALLQNASATGGLRGGNIQSALAQFRPQVLSAAINDRYGRLSNLAGLGLGAATQTGVFGNAATNNITNLQQQIGNVRAGGILAEGSRDALNFNNLLQGIGAGARIFGAF
jgi:hypothetical protein